MKMRVRACFLAAVMLACCFQQPAGAQQQDKSVALEDGLIAHLPFEGGLFAKGNGTIQARAIGGVSYGPGVSGSSLALHGDDYAELPDSPALRPITLSICAWVCPQKAYSNGRIAEKGDSNSYWLNLAAGKARFGFYSEGHYQEIDSSTVLKPMEWTFIAGTYDGSSLRIYVNGEMEGMLKVHNPINHNAQPLLIGWKPNGIANDHLIGWIDELRLYGRALTRAEVQTLADPATR